MKNEDALISSDIIEYKVSILVNFKGNFSKYNNLYIS